MHRSRENSTLQNKDPDNSENTKSRPQNNEQTDLNGVTEDKDEKLILIVRDNGKGFPENLDFRNTTSLGLQLVTTLVDQIEGDIRLDRCRGTSFEISFLRK